MTRIVRAENRAGEYAMRLGESSSTLVGSERGVGPRWSRFHCSPSTKHPLSDPERGTEGGASRCNQRGWVILSRQYAIHDYHAAPFSPGSLARVLAKSRPARAARADKAIVKLRCVRRRDGPAHQDAILRVRRRSVTARDVDDSTIGPKGCIVARSVCIGIEPLDPRSSLDSREHAAVVKCISLGGLTRNSS